MVGSVRRQLSANDSSQPGPKSELLPDKLESNRQRAADLEAPEAAPEPEKRMGRDGKERVTD
jgi:hypothetical protein